MASFEDQIKKFEQSIEEIPSIIADAELYAAQESEVQLLLRTFAVGGSGVKDTTGKALSKYSEQYAKKRERAGLQTANKELVFSKDSSAIKDNISIGLSDGKAALGHVNERGYLISTYQEEREGVIIFQLSDSEKAIVADKVKQYVMKRLREMVAKWKE